MSNASVPPLSRRSPQRAGGLSSASPDLVSAIVFPGCAEAAGGSSSSASAMLRVMASSHADLAHAEVPFGGGVRPGRRRCGGGALLARQPSLELAARAGYPALRRAHCTSGSFRDLLVRHALQDDHEERFALIGWQAAQRPAQLLEHHPVFVRGAHGEGGAGQVLDIGGFALLPQRADEAITEDAVHPGGEVGPGREAVLGG